MRCVIFRVPGIYGPYRLPLERLRRGEPAMRPEDAGPGNRIHVDDLVTACVAALDGAAQRHLQRDRRRHCEHHGIPAAHGRTGRPAAAATGRRAEAQHRISPGMLAFLNERAAWTTGACAKCSACKPLYADVRAGIAASLEEMRASLRG